MLLISVSFLNSIGEIYFPWFPLSGHSQLVRHANLALSTALRSAPEDECCLSLTPFFVYMRQAIDRKSIMEVFVSSYAALLYAFRRTESLETLLVYFNGMRSTFRELRNGRANPVGWANFEMIVSSLMRAGYRTLLCACLGRKTTADEDSDLFKKMRSAVQRSTNLMCRYSRHNLHIFNIYLSQPSENIHGHVKCRFGDSGEESNWAIDLEPSLESSVREILDWSVESGMEDLSWDWSCIRM